MLEDPAHWIQRVGSLAWSTLPKGSRCIPLKAIRAPAKGVSHSLVPAKNVCSCRINVTMPLPSFHHSVVLWGRLQRTAKKAPSLVSCRLAYPFKSHAAACLPSGSILISKTCCNAQKGVCAFIHLAQGKVSQAYSIPALGGQPPCSIIHL